jgi:hypothetical protein
MTRGPSISRLAWLVVLLPALLPGMVRAQAPGPDLEATTADGRRVLLKADGSWAFVPAASAAAASAVAPAASVPAVPAVPAELELVGRNPVPGGCHVHLSLHNKLDYEIRTLVPEFRIVRKGGPTYVEQSLGFGRLLPGDRQQRTLRVSGLDCAAIEKIQVTGGDRCDMGELHRFSEGKGLCLARVRVKPSELIGFEK